MHIWLVAQQTLLRLRRERVLLVAITLLVGVSAFAQLASSWGIDESYRLLFDIGMLGFHLIGSLMAIFWGTKLVGDAIGSGLLETQLATRLSRTSWLIGSYLGLCLCLLILGGVVAAVWQGLMILNGFGALTPPQTMAVVSQVGGWLVLGAIGLCLGSWVRFEVAFFSTLGLWVVGLSAKAVYLSLSSEEGPLFRFVLEALSEYFDLQRFNVAFWELEFLPVQVAINTGLYCIGLCCFFLSAAVVAFNQRDLEL